MVAIEMERCNIRKREQKSIKRNEANQLSKETNF